MKFLVPVMLSSSNLPDEKKVNTTDRQTTTTRVSFIATTGLVVSVNFIPWEDAKGRRAPTGSNCYLHSSWLGNWWSRTTGRGRSCRTPAKGVQSLHHHWVPWSTKGLPGNSQWHHPRKFTTTYMRHILRCNPFIQLNRVVYNSFSCSHLPWLGHQRRMVDPTKCIRQICSTLCLL